MSFCTVINCIDGRVQLPVISYLQNRFDVEHVDVVTETGPVGVLSTNPESDQAKSIFRKVEVSIQAHLSKGIAIVAHHDCAGNPLPDSEQQLQIQNCLEILSKRYPEMEVFGLWLGQNWTINEF
jgi:hypothetical protein